MFRFWYFTIIISIVTFMLATFTWMGLPVSTDEKYIERYMNTEREEFIDKKDLQLFFLDLGRNEATLIISPDEQITLIDVGDTSSYEKLKQCLLDLNINKINFVFLTTDVDEHIGAFSLVYSDFKIDNVFVSKQSKIPNSNKIFSKNNLLFKEVKKKKSINIGKNLYAEVLHENPIIMSIEYNNYMKILMMSDANYELEEKLISEYKGKLKSQILKVGNHGQRLTCTDDFLKVVDPQIAVILGGDIEDNSRPSYGVIERLTETWIDVYRNDIKGTIKIDFDGSTYGVKTDLDD